MHSHIHTKKRNKLLHDRMRDLVFVKFNSKLRNKKQNKDRDPIEKDVEDVQADNDNEFIMGAVYVPSEHVEPEPQHGASHGQESASQAQGKRKRPVHRRKKKVRSLESLIHQVSLQSGLPGALSSDSEDGDSDTQMHSSDSDKSPGASDSDE